jgi:hypothetical protein
MATRALEDEKARKTSSESVHECARYGERVPTQQANDGQRKQYDSKALQHSTTITSSTAAAQYNRTRPAREVEKDQREMVRAR